MYESCELGGTYLGDRMVKIGDKLYYGRSDINGGFIIRIWAVYLDGILLKIKLTLSFGKREYKSKYSTREYFKFQETLITTTDDHNLRLTRG